MIALASGLGAAFAWAAAALCARAATGVIGPWSTVAWVMIAGLALVLPLIVLTGTDIRLTRATLLLMVGAGTANAAGLPLEYIALRRGKSGVVTAIVSTEGVIAAVLSTLAGARLRAVTAVALAAIAVGLVIAARAQDERNSAPAPHRQSASVLACVVAAIFGVSVYCSGRLGQEAPLLVAVLPARIAGVVIFAIPLALRGRLASPRAAALPVLSAGAAEVLGVACLAVGSRTQLAVTAVMASLFPIAVSAIAFVRFDERLNRKQLMAVAIIVAAAAVVAASQ